MSFEVPGVGAPNEVRSRYGSSKLMVRGPSRNLDDPYVAFLGGNETYGRHVQTPFVSLLENEIGKNCINLGVANAGLDAFVNDPELLTIARNADQVVIQVLGAQNLSNRYYRVHSRRNDRFLAASSLLSSIYQDVDFTDYNFIKHMLRGLQKKSADRFASVKTEIQQAWLSRMRLLIQTIHNDIILLWLKYDDDNDELGPEPLAITDAMIDQLRPVVGDVVKINVVPARKSGEIKEMVFSQMHAAAAGHLVGPSAHRQIAKSLIRKLGT